MIVIALAMLVASPTQQPEPPRAAKAVEDPTALAAATALLETEGFEQQALDSAAMMVELMLAGMTEQLQKRTGDEVPETFLARLRETLREHSASTLKANMPSIKREAARIYAEEFTAAELVRMRQIAADPLMAKARQRQKVMAPKLAMVGVRAMRESEPELEAKVQRLIEEYLASRPGGNEPS